MSARVWIMIGAMLAGLGVAAGAFGAHVLKDRLAAPQLDNFDVAVRYQLYHALGLILLGLVGRSGGGWGRTAGWSFLAGIVLFSGCLAAYALTGQKALVYVVPVGGMAFILGWIAFGIAAWKERF